MSDVLDRRQRLEDEAAFHEYKSTDDGAWVDGRDAYSAYYRVLTGQEKFFVDRIGSLEGVRVLSYGCGTGYVTPLARQGARVTGLDISESAIDYLRGCIEREGLCDVADAQVGDCEATPFDDAEFDLVIGSGILHHLDVDRAGAEIGRVLKPGGRAIFREPLDGNPLVNLYRRLTPQHRTVFEHPFGPKDFHILEKHFSRVWWRPFGLMSLMALSLHRCPRAVDAVVPPLDALDLIVTSAVPPSRWLAWSAVIELTR